jgi:hypothetical protein
MSNGKKLLYRSENAGNITTAWCADAVTGVQEKTGWVSSAVSPNPIVSTAVLHIDPLTVLNQAQLRIYNTLGKEIISFPIENHDLRFSREGLPQGACFYQLLNNGQVISTGKLIIL